MKKTEHTRAYSLFTTEEGSLPFRDVAICKVLMSQWMAIYTSVHMGRLNDLRFINSGGKGHKVRRETGKKALRKVQEGSRGWV